MKCNKVQEELLSYIDKELSAGESKKLQDHLLECEECKRKHEILQETEKSLKNFGGAVRLGRISMEAPPLPPLEQPSFWARIRSWFGTPIPLWVPSAAGVAVILMFALTSFSPLDLSIEWGASKGSGNIGVIAPPLSAEGMLEFLIVPDAADTGQLAASIEAVETFLRAHPEDLAMHAKLIELYQSRLKLGTLLPPEHTVLTEKLAIHQTQFTELLKKGHLMKGDTDGTQ